MHACNTMSCTCILARADVSLFRVVKKRQREKACSKSILPFQSNPTPGWVGCTETVGCAHEVTDEARQALLDSSDSVGTIDRKVTVTSPAYSDCMIIASHCHHYLQCNYQCLTARQCTTCPHTSLGSLGIAR